MNITCISHYLFSVITLITVTVGCQVYKMRVSVLYLAELDELHECHVEWSLGSHRGFPSPDLWWDHWPQISGFHVFSFPCMTLGFPEIESHVC